MKQFSENKLYPLHKQLITRLVLCGICVFFILCWSILDYVKLQKNSLHNYLDLYSTQLASTTKQAYTAYENIAYSIAYNVTVQEYIRQTNPSNRYDSYQTVYNLLNNTSKLNSNIADIAIISAAGNSLSLTASPKLYDCYAQAAASPSYAFQSMGTLHIRDIPCHILSMPVHQLTISGQNEYLGTVFLAINSRRMFHTDLSLNMKEHPSILLVDEYGTLVAGDEDLLKGIPQKDWNDAINHTINGTPYLIRTFSINEAGGRLYVLFNTSSYTQAALFVSLRLSLGIALVMLVIILFLTSVSFPVSSSLRDLTHVMRDITAGKQQTIKNGVDISTVTFSCLEIHDIYIAFNEMMSEINRLNHTIFNTYTQMYELEMNKRQTEIAFLRSQINPHFLYNTLTTICGMSAAGMNEQIIEVTNALSRIFRYSIQGSDMVSLEEELAIIRAYLKIQTYRFEDRFSISYQIQPNTMTCQIPKMIIQPLVENAIVHGLEPSLRRGKLTISSSLDKQAQYLTISIMDTGVGMSKEKLSDLRKQLLESLTPSGATAKEHLQEMDQKNHDSIGLFNVNNRIVLYYGEAYSLQIDSWEHAGTNIQIRIPCHYEKPSIEPSSIVDFSIKQKGEQ